MNAYHDVDVEKVKDAFGAGGRSDADYCCKRNIVLALKGSEGWLDVLAALAAGWALSLATTPTSQPAPLSVSESDENEGGGILFDETELKVGAIKSPSVKFGVGYTFPQ